MVDLAPQAALQTEAAARPSIRRYYVLALLTVIYALNFLDRTIFNVLIEPIKKEFALSDTTMGLLAGFGFVLFYSVLGIPIARLADRFNRRNIVAVALALWSAMTVFCGMAQSVATLALARIGVGIGESPAARPPRSRSLPISSARTNAPARSASTPSARILAYSSAISSAAISTSTTAGGWRSIPPACPASHSPRCCG
jgi:MFS family permease